MIIRCHHKNTSIKCRTGSSVSFMLVNFISAEMISLSIVLIYISLMVLSQTQRVEHFVYCHGNFSGFGYYHDIGLKCSQTHLTIQPKYIQDIYYICMTNLEDSLYIYVYIHTLFTIQIEYIKQYSWSLLLYTTSDSSARDIQNLEQLHKSHVQI